MSKTRESLNLELDETKAKLSAHKTRRDAIVIEIHTLKTKQKEELAKQTKPKKSKVVEVDEKSETSMDEFVKLYDAFASYKIVTARKGGIAGVKEKMRRLFDLAISLGDDTENAKVTNIRAVVRQKDTAISKFDADSIAEFYLAISSNPIMDVLEKVKNLFFEEMKKASDKQSYEVGLIKIVGASGLTSDDDTRIKKYDNKVRSNTKTYLKKLQNVINHTRVYANSTDDGHLALRLWFHPRFDTDVLHALDSYFRHAVHAWTKKYDWEKGTDHSWINMTELRIAMLEIEISKHALLDYLYYDRTDNRSKSLALERLVQLNEIVEGDIKTLEQSIIDQIRTIETKDYDKIKVFEAQQKKDRSAVINLSEDSTIFELDKLRRTNSVDMDYSKTYKYLSNYNDHEIIKPEYDDDDNEVECETGYDDIVFAPRSITRTMMNAYNKLSKK